MQNKHISKLKKAFVAVCASLVVLSPISAFAATKDTPPINQPSTMPITVQNATTASSSVHGSSTITGDSSSSTTVQPNGIKSWAVEHAVIVLADAIRYGGPALSKVVSFLDAPAASALSRYSASIAEQLDIISEIPDLVVNAVKDKIYYFMLNDLKLGGGTSLEIADAIAATLNWLVF